MRISPIRIAGLLHALTQKRSSLARGKIGKPKMVADIFTFLFYGVVASSPIWVSWMGGKFVDAFSRSKLKATFGLVLVISVMVFLGYALVRYGGIGVALI